MLGLPLVPAGDSWWGRRSFPRPTTGCLWVKNGHSGLPYQCPLPSRWPNVWEGEGSFGSVRQNSFLELGCYVLSSMSGSVFPPSVFGWEWGFWGPGEASQTRLPVIAVSCVLLPPCRQWESQTWCRKKSISPGYLFLMSLLWYCDLYEIHIWSHKWPKYKMLRISWVTRPIIGSIFCHNISSLVFSSWNCFRAI